MNTEDTRLTSDDEISSHELFLKLKGAYLYLLSKWFVILLFFVLGSGLGFLYSYYKKPVYIAVTSFVLEDGGSGGGIGGNLGGLASMVGIDVGGGGGIFQGDNILELYKSRSMIEKALLSEIIFSGKKELLVDRYIQFNNLREKWKNDPNLKGIEFKAKASTVPNENNMAVIRLRDSILGNIVNDIKLNNLNVSKADKKLSVIKAYVQFNDEFFAKAFNDQIVKTVNDFYVQTKTKKSLENVSIMQLKTDSVRAAMNGAIFSSASTLDATPNLNPTRQVLRVGVQGAQLSAETNKAILAELVKNLELSKISLRKETPLIQVIDSPIFPLEKKSISAVKGLVFGAFFGVMLSCSLLLLIRFFKNIN